jgi:hypothetical protein
MFLWSMTKGNFFFFTSMRKGKYGHAYSIKKGSAVVWKMAPCCLMWCLWTERNDRQFEDKEITIEDLISFFLHSLYSWTACALRFSNKILLLIKKNICGGLVLIFLFQYCYLLVFAFFTYIICM